MWQDVGLGIVLGLPVALLNHRIARRSSMLAENAPGIAGINIIMKWSLLRMVIAMVALIAAMQLGPAVMIGVFAALALEMGVYICYLFGYAKALKR